MQVSGVGGVAGDAYRTRLSFKAVLNNAVRTGLREAAAASERKPNVVKARPMKLRAGVDPARLSELGVELEIDAFATVTQRLKERPQ